MSCEVDIGETTVTFTIEGFGRVERVSVKRRDPGTLRMTVTDSRGVTKTGEIGSGTSMTLGIYTSLGSLIEQSDLPEASKREARGLLQQLTPQNLLLFLNIVKGSGELWGQIGPHLIDLLNLLK